MGDDALTVLDLSLEYGDGEFCALRDVSFAINDTEFVALLGPSGCGKSSLLSVIAGFVRSSQGQVTAFGKPVVGPGPDRGIVFQRHSLFPWKTALENIMYPLECKGLDRAEARTQATDWLVEVGLEGFEDLYPGELSGGMQQRVAVARLFAADPRVFLLDEPFGALDAYTKLQMQELLLRIWDRHRRTVLFVTHDTEEALLLADRVLIMSATPGTILEQFAVPLRRPRSAAALFAPEIVTLRQHVLSLMQQEHRKRILFDLGKTKRPDSGRHLRLGYVSDIAALPLLAASKGLGDHAVRTELVMEPNGDVIIEEVTSGRLDLGEVSLVAALLAAQRGRRFKIISGWGTFNASSGNLIAVYALEGASPTGLKRLLGKRIGLNGFGTLTEFLVRRAFQDLGQIPQLVSLRSETFRFALEQRVVEAVAAIDPWLGLLRDASGFEEVRSLDAYLPPDPLFVLVASEEAVRSRKLALGELLSACQTGWARVQSSVEVRNQLIGEFLGVRPPEFSESFALRPCYAVTVDDLEASKDLLTQVGMTKETTHLDCSGLLHLLS
ncbi:MAG: ATP-binding cassette domain-containing protein [Planctomycetota bacterium]